MDQALEILLGLSSAVDYEVSWDAETVSELAAAWAIDSWPAVPQHIHDERDLLCAILAYSAAGTGTERAVDSVAAIESIARRLGFRESLGGTGVRAGRVLDLLGIDCTVHLSSLSPHVQRLLWPGARYLASRREPTVYPHLIVQYTSDGPLTVGGITRTPPRPNRLIFVNDPTNAELALAPDLPETAAHSLIWLISGINAITDSTLLQERLDQIKIIARAMPPAGWAVYEDSGFHRHDLAATALSAMAGVCDIVSMNEDEFAAHLAAPVNMDDPRSVHRGLADVARTWNIRNLVVHTSSWAAAVGPQSSQLRTALSEGVRVSAARYLMGDDMTADHVEQLRSAPTNQNGATVAAGLERAGVTATAALALRPLRPVTIGLGDSFVGGFLAGLHRSGVRPDREPFTSMVAATGAVEEIVRRR